MLIWTKKPENYKVKHQEQFWSCKFTSKSNLNEKNWKLWIKKKSRFLKAYIKLEKVIKLDDIEIKRQKLHKHKGPISIKNEDIKKTVVSNKVSFGKAGVNISLATKML